MKKRLAALVCALAVFCAVLGPGPSARASSSSTIYLLAVNDKLCDLPAGVLPLALGGVIYVPYSVFDKDATGVDLGVYYGLVQDRNTILSLYSASGSLSFDIYQGVCTDGQENQMDFRAALRNGIPYVPAAAVCAYFGLQYSLLPTSDRGTLVRISNSAASHSDSVFLDLATQAMATRYNNLVKDLVPRPTSTPAPAATSTPAPSGGSNKENVRVYLALDASASNSDLTALFPSGVRALFLFTPDSLTTHAAQVRKAVAAGHSIGLIVEGDTQSALADLERGNDLLIHIARVRTRIAAAPRDLTGALNGAGWTCWQPNVTGSTASAVLSDLDARRAVGRVTLPTAPAAVSRVLARIREDGYTLRRVVETEL